jgi:uncharacterized protein (TIGR00297 family)
VNPAVAAAIAGALALVARSLGWLNTGGAIAAAVVGAAVFTGGGLTGAALLSLFFVSGSLLTRYSSQARSDRLDPQTGGRTARQVLANGSCAAVGAVIAPSWEGGWALLLGALAAAQADTWATEIGAFSAKPPRLISTGLEVPRGTSGGVTLLGSGGGLIGAAVMATLAGLLGLTPKLAVAGLLAGFAAMLFDSLLGATVQGIYHCETCDAAGERRLHVCGNRAGLVRGWAFLDNDAVNLVATCSGGLVAVLLWWIT